MKMNAKNEVFNNFFDEIVEGRRKDKFTFIYNMLFFSDFLSLGGL